MLISTSFLPYTVGLKRAPNPASTPLVRKLKFKLSVPSRFVLWIVWKGQNVEKLSEYILVYNKSRLQFLTIFLSISNKLITV